MLIKRIITALVLIPAIIAAVFLLPNDYFNLFCALFILVAGWEWVSISGVNDRIVKIIFLVFLGLSMQAMGSWVDLIEYLVDELHNLDIYELSGIIDWLAIGPVLWWLFAMILIRNAGGSLLEIKIKKRFKLILGWVLLLSAWLFFTRLRALYGNEMIMYFLLLIWAADIAAYFVGRKYGEMKLAPEISPGKTTAGLYGAIISALLMGVGLGFYYGFPLIIAANFVMLSMFTVLVSIYGDLFISLLKRRQGVKDSGTLLPGHGGVLDRLDSLIAAIPVFYLGVILIRQVS
ncbi:MAG TPA: phosphatidate cytidylyltransferase [Methylococcaceae bacterium]|jgi:phosphatidate cytidylyltransferase|nr:phosphatidate cytidylyltransferase [Methylococcaceae bacterium]HIN68683.1 phosphatidate cytidylyltransferase [Methylococcales bacterium]HIA45613.1 phosphatidate cytidylyltransferase [Methylococcaceae bacterium]HIB62671.1 phosphatidate cytidylyltransferase [Methylococcaceae bacterium]HIO13493.1 phosphatidate cytidylyltransferase [Methylococcales bacterium]